MKVKGTSVKSTLQYVKEVHPDYLQQWLDALPDNIRQLMLNPIMSTQWFQIEDGMIIPTETLAKIISEPDINIVARKIGAYTAKIGLKSVYKVFVKVASPNYVLRRSQRVFNTYYSEGKFITIVDEAKRAVFDVIGFKKQHETVFSRICGWLDETLIITNSRKGNVTYSVTQLENNNVSVRIAASWE